MKRIVQLIGFLFVVDSYFIESDCSQRYCVSQSSSGLAISVSSSYALEATEIGLSFPDNDFYIFLRSKNVHESQITKLEFDKHCNVVFNLELLHTHPIQNLQSLRFDKICWLNSVQYGYCLDVPSEWRQSVQLVNNRFCLNTKSEIAPELLDEVAMLYDQLDDSKQYVQFLNNSLNRALHLYKGTEMANKQIQTQLDKADRESKTCNSNLNKTVSLNRLRSRQILKCAAQLERLQELKIDSFKSALEELYSNFINTINNL